MVCVSHKQGYFQYIAGNLPFSELTTHPICPYVIVLDHFLQRSHYLSASKFSHFINIGCATNRDSPTLVNLGYVLNTRDESSTTKVMMLCSKPDKPILLYSLLPSKYILPLLSTTNYALPHCESPEIWKGQNRYPYFLICGANNVVERYGKKNPAQASFWGLT